MNPITEPYPPTNRLVRSNATRFVENELELNHKKRIVFLQRLRIAKALIIPALCIALFIIIMYIINNDKQQQKQLNEQANKLNEYSNNLSSLISQTNTMVPIINNLGVRVNNLDKQTTNVIEMITVPTKNSFQVRKYNFTPSSYAAELEFFKTLSPSDQINYLNMSKEAKRLKYSTPKSN
jgi:hypothetical protein